VSGIRRGSRGVQASAHPRAALTVRSSSEPDRPPSAGAAKAGGQRPGGVKAASGYRPRCGIDFARRQSRPTNLATSLL
jgi:hypothetical protein